VLFAGPAFSAGYAWYALSGARAKTAAKVGLALALVQLLGAIVIIAVGLVTEPPSNRVW